MRRHRDDPIDGSRNGIVLAVGAEGGEGAGENEAATVARGDGDEISREYFRPRLHTELGTVASRDGLHYGSLATP